MRKLTERQKLFLICGTHFADWTDCGSEWDFAPDTVRDAGSAKEVVLRSHKANAKGLKKVMYATLTPQGMFECGTVFLADGQGNIVGNTKMFPFRDTRLSDAVRKR